jgi:hypothetical protein
MGILATRLRVRLSLTFLIVLGWLASLPALAGEGPGGRTGIVGLNDTTFVRQQHRRLTFQFDQRYSLVDSRLAGINGLKIGIEWRGRYRAGAGLYLLSPGVKAITPGLANSTSSELRFKYAAVYGEYVIRGNPRWEISTPVQFGYGKYYHEQISPEGVRERSARDRVFLLEPTIGGHYRIFRWFGLGGGIGWREAFSVKPEYANQLDGPIFYGRAKLFLGDLVKVARGRQRLFTQRGLRRADWQQPTLDDNGEE